MINQENNPQKVWKEREGGEEAFMILSNKLNFAGIFVFCFYIYTYKLFIRYGPTLCGEIQRKSWDREEIALEIESICST